MKYIINQVLRNGRYGISAFGKARQDINRIFEEIGATPVNIVCQLSKVPFLANLRVVMAYLSFLRKSGKGNEFFIQYPVSMRKSFPLVLKLIRRYQNKLYFVVHDVNFARFGVEREKDIAFLNAADGLIIHTPAMEKLLHENGIHTPMSLLQVFDYFSEDDFIEKQEVLSNKHTVIYAGNLAKSKFVAPLLQHTFSKVKFSLFGNKGDLQIDEQDKEYKGIFQPDHTASIGGGWGLVWDGESIHTCTGDTGTYLKWNSPHKLSLYLAAGLPVIVWKESAEAEFVEREKLGITISSIEELDERLSNISDEDFSEMIDNARKQGEILRKGGKTLAAYQQLIGG